MRIHSAHRLHLIILVLLAVVLGQVSLTASDRVLTIVTGKSNAPLPAVTVRIRCLDAPCRDSVVTLLSGADGTFVVPFNTRVELNISCAGFESRLDTMSADDAYNFYLAPVEFATDEIVVTGQFLPTKRSESLYDVDIIPAQQIKAQGATTLAQLLSNRAGMRLAQDNLLGSSLSIQGLGGNNVKILIDGVPVIGRTNGNIDLSQINLNNAERVEIVDDPLSVRYGTNALGGVINIITRDNNTPRLHLEAGSYLESVGHYNNDALLSWGLNDFSLSLAGGRNLFDGFNNPDTSRFQQWKPKEQYFADVNAALKLDDTRLRASTRFFNEFIWNRGEPRAPYRETAFDDEYHTRRLTNSLFVNHAVSSDASLDLTLSHSWYRRRKNSYFKDLTTGKTQLTGGDTEQDTSVFKAILARLTYSADALDGDIAWQAGLDFNLEDVEGGRIEEGVQTIDDYAVFGAARMQPVESFEFQPGLRYAYNTRFDAPLLPSINTRFNLADGIVLRASWAEGFRAPSLRELYFLFVDINHNIRGNGELEAEKSRHYKLDLQWTTDSQQHSLKMQPGLFYNDVNNLISLAQVEGDLFSYVNIGEVRTLGLDLDVTYRRSNASAEISFSYLGRSTGLDAQTDNSDVGEYSFAPEFSAGVMYTLTEHVDLNLFYKYSGELPQYTVDADGSVREGSIDDYQLLDCSASVKLFDSRLTMTGGVKNIFDVVNISNSLNSNDVHSDAGGSVSIGTGRSLFLRLDLNTL